MRLGVYSYYLKGALIGTITLEDGQLIASSPEIQEIADAQDGIESLKHWSNGYLWIKPLPPEE